MKKVLLILAMIVLVSIPVLAESETILSLSTGANTGFVGFTLERMVNSHSGYLGLGVGIMQDFRLCAGYRLYLPDSRSGKNQRSNIYISPNAGIALAPSYTYNPNTGYSVFEGYQAHAWGALTMGYDHRWGSAKQYRLTLEGGLGYGGHEENLPLVFGIVPVFDFSLGYIF
jgi:hypothetical protein